MLVTCAVALVSVLVTALVAVPLAVRGAERRDQEALAAQARLAAEVLRTRLDRGRTADEERLIRQLRDQGIDAYLIRRRGGRPGGPAAPGGAAGRGRDATCRCAGR